ncbi:MAG: hypothetical protein R3C53_06540 [Pirellulaceae bacterium]
MRLSDLLTIDLRERVERLRGRGIELTEGWPRAWQSSVREWVGTRWFLSFAANFSNTRKFVAIASSSLGRHGRYLPHWPQLLDLALQSIARTSQTLLVAPGSTFATASREYAQQAAVPWLDLHWSRHTTLASWLMACLDELESDVTYDLRDRILVSPPIEENSAATNTPLQDRLAIGLADHVLALSVRPRGKIEQLISQRLGDSRFPLGSLFIALPAAESPPETPGTLTARTAGASKHSPQFRSRQRRESKHRDSPHLDWLERGAVGWYVSPKLLQDRLPFTHCRHETMQPVQQLVSPAPPWWNDPSDGSAWPWLTHCTRGQAGPQPHESDNAYRRRLWTEGRLPDSHPLYTLNQICESRKLIGNGRLTRNSQPGVSFSAVPLVALLSRRQFRSHLGRWDWEPYGLLVHRAALQAAGARPVIYGDNSTFAGLPESEQPYFQSSGKPTTDHAIGQWAAEQEWRWLGDLDLRKLPHQAVCLFVPSQREAQQLSRHCPWPVLAIKVG